ncbi:hypothetical protein EVAR_99428_1 [Eumeta japonica]|uniref:GAG-pre-integrase domain-containing protein n=1 Tax=Eumeta variegata TaxID=151549 RepID=A0A4C1ZD82_EUMVA|nr:hypothetical protein EVAR_99428_1 [Eumeta japonica]
MATLVNNVQAECCLRPSILSTTNDDFYLWHQRLGHLNYNDMKKLKDHTDGVTMPQNSELTCVPCIKGKQARSPFPCEAREIIKIVDLWRNPCGLRQSELLHTLPTVHQREH